MTSWWHCQITILARHGTWQAAIVAARLSNDKRISHVRPGHMSCQHVAGMSNRNFQMGACFPSGNSKPQQQRSNHRTKSNMSRWAKQPRCTSHGRVAWPRSQPLQIKSPSYHGSSSSWGSYQSKSKCAAKTWMHVELKGHALRMDMLSHCESQATYFKTCLIFFAISGDKVRYKSKLRDMGFNHKMLSTGSFPPFPQHVFCEVPNL